MCESSPGFNLVQLFLLAVLPFSALNSGIVWHFLYVAVTSLKVALVCNKITSFIPGLLLNISHFSAIIIKILLKSHKPRQPN